MAATAKKAQVVSEVRQKQSNGTFENHPIGVEARFVGPVRQTNNGNLEEQILLGYDDIVFSATQEDGTEIIHKSFTDDETKTNYYILDTTIASLQNALAHGEITYLRDNTIYFSHNTIDLTDQEIRDLKGNGFMTLRADGTILAISVEFVKQVDTLKFKQADSNIIEVSKKSTTYGYDPSGKTIKRKVETLMA